jgi:hypothetical protein
LIVDAIKDCTARGDLILDPFLGSGTAVIASSADAAGMVLPRSADLVLDLPKSLLYGNFGSLDW